MDVVTDVGERSGHGLRVGQEALLGIAHAERERLGRMIQFADPATWEQPSAAAGWWNRDVMAHLTANDTAAAQLFAGQPAEEMDGYRAQLEDGSFTVDGWNAWAVGRRTGLETREVLETWGRAAEAMLVYAARLDAGAWRDTRFPWIAGELSPRFLIQSTVIEWFLHGEDMRATNGVASGWQVGWQHWPVHLTIDMAVRLLPWALGREGRDLSGKSAAFELIGAGEGTWHWGLGPGEVPAKDAEPDVVITGRAPQFALVAGRRIPVEDALASGNVVLGGDLDLANVVIRAIRAYP
ncbi:MAG TPA: maleylpyruvate isomerase family mycothiol-dependent enzyme [Actinomycetota bacterium]|nr:maleylpyruvate isomerase family mycothiol-dependent enzyme [Actinomycetota bacterium]